MNEKELKDQLAVLENYIDDLPNVIQPCGMCKNKTDVFSEICAECCWFYASHFEIKSDGGNK